MYQEHYVIAKQEHWKQRVQERVFGIHDFDIPNDFWNKDDDKKLITEILLTSVKKILDNKISAFTSNYSDDDPSKFYITTIGIVEFKRNNRIYNPVFKAKSQGNYGLKDNEGNEWVALTTQDSLITLLLFNAKSSYTSQLITATIRHKDHLTKKDFVVRKTSNASTVIDVDKLIELKTRDNTPKKILTPKDLDYEVRGDYRKTSESGKSLFKHKVFGNGEIIASTSGGMQSRGKWDYIKVRFPKGIKEFTGLYTTTYFLNKENILLEWCLKNWL